MSTFHKYREIVFGALNNIASDIPEFSEGIKKGFKKVIGLADSVLGSLGKILASVTPFIDAIAQFKDVYAKTRKTIE